MGILCVRKIGTIATIPPVHWGVRCLPSFARIAIQYLSIDGTFTDGGTRGVSCNDNEAFWLTVYRENDVPQCPRICSGSCLDSVLFSSEGNALGLPCNMTKMGHRPFKCCVICKAAALDSPLIPSLLSRCKR